MIAAGVLNATASVYITADRSLFHSEATIAIRLNSIGWNSLNISVLATAYLFPNSTLSIIGLIAMIIPATAPIGTNAYLFDSPGRYHKWRNGELVESRLV